jgi:hypothetical protein
MKKTTGRKLMLHGQNVFEDNDFTLQNLQTISLIKKDKKAYAKNGMIRIPVNNYFFPECAVRWANGWSRNDVMQCIETTYTNAFDHIKNSRKEKNFSKEFQYVLQLNRSLRGLNSLMNTYKEDVQVKVQLNMIIERVQLQMFNFRLIHLGEPFQTLRNVVITDKHEKIE